GLVRQDRLDAIAVMQRGAGIGDHQLALLHALADLDVGVGIEAEPDLTSLHHIILDHLYRRGFAAEPDRRARNRYAAALAGVDSGAGEHPGANRGIVFEAHAHLAELGLAIDLGQHDAHPTRYLAAIVQLHPRGLAGIELRQLRARNVALHLELVVDDD